VFQNIGKTGLSRRPFLRSRNFGPHQLRIKPGLIEEEGESRMKSKIKAAVSVVLFGILLTQFQAGPLRACSTFKLQKGDALLYGHNLNQPGMNVPGQIFINKRGVFKIGRSGSEMLTKENMNPSTLSWISRYGSVTFSTFGKDMPDGGVNEAGLYIWEMSSETEYPKNDSLPKLLQMNWMQFVLDNFSTLDEAVASAHDIEIDGWAWHYFVGDAQGRCASIEFIKGQVVVHRGDDMPVPALFNVSYARELDVARYFQGFGGFYAPDLNDKKVPRFVKTAVMLRDYDPTQDAVEYGLKILGQIKVNDVPDWSVLVDIRRRTIYFKTALNPELKKFSVADLDFSNRTPALVLNMDQKQGGDTASLFHAVTDREIREFIAALPLPDDFFTQGGMTKEDFVERFATHAHAAENPARQFFQGIWKTKPEEGTKPSGDAELTVGLKVVGGAVTGEIRNAKGEKYPLDHIHLVKDNLSFTFHDLRGTVFIVKAVLDVNKMDLQLWGIEDLMGGFALYRQ
jgi:choloylglycine hydrolase